MPSLASIIFHRCFSSTTSFVDFDQHVWVTEIVWSLGQTTPNGLCGSASIVPSIVVSIWTLWSYNNPHVCTNLSLKNMQRCPQKASMIWRPQLPALLYNLWPLWTPVPLGYITVVQRIFACVKILQFCNFEAFLRFDFCNRARTWLACQWQATTYFFNHKPTHKIYKNKVHAIMCNYSISCLLLLSSAVKVRLLIWWKHSHPGMWIDTVLFSV